MFVLNENIEIADVEWDPAPIRALVNYKPEVSTSMSHLDDDFVLVCSEGEFMGNMYVIKLY